MVWNIFSYKNDTTINFKKWLERLLNGLQAENFVIMDKNTVCVYYHSSHSDEFDDNGQPI